MGNNICRDDLLKLHITLSIYLSVPVSVWLCVCLAVCLSWHRNWVVLPFFLPGSFTKGWPQSTLIVHCDLTWANWSSKLFLGWCWRSPISIYQHTCCTEGHCVFGDTPPHCLPFFFPLTSRESPRAQPWGPSPRFWSSSPASDLLDVNPRRPVRVDSLCWRASVSSVTPPAPSATGTSCLNALPVELVSTITYVRTEIGGGCSKGGEKRLNVLLFVTPRCTRFKLRWVQTNVLRSLISAKTINNSTATTMASWKLNNIPGIVWQISDISQCLLERWKKNH